MLGDIVQAHLPDVILQFPSPLPQPVGADSGPGKDFPIEPFMLLQGICERIAHEGTDVTELSEIVMQLDELV